MYLTKYTHAATHCTHPSNQKMHINKHAYTIPTKTKAINREIVQPLVTACQTSGLAPWRGHLHLILWCHVRSHFDHVRSHSKHVWLFGEVTLWPCLALWSHFDHVWLFSDVTFWPCLALLWWGHILTMPGSLVRSGPTLQWGHTPTYKWLLGEIKLRRLPLLTLKLTSDS